MYGKVMTLTFIQLRIKVVYAGEHIVLYKNYNGFKHLYIFIIVYTGTN